MIFFKTEQRLASSALLSDCFPVIYFAAGNAIWVSMTEYNLHKNITSIKFRNWLCLMRFSILPPLPLCLQLGLSDYFSLLFSCLHLPCRMMTLNKTKTYEPFLTSDNLGLYFMQFFRDIRYSNTLPYGEINAIRFVSVVVDDDDCNDGFIDSTWGHLLSQ